jgi:hypothetical protein
VCDGRKALILESIGDEVFPNLHTNGCAAACARHASGRLFLCRPHGYPCGIGKDLVKLSVLEIEEQLLSAQIPQPPGDQRADGILQPA